MFYLNCFKLIFFIPSRVSPEKKNRNERKPQVRLKATFKRMSQRAISPHQRYQHFIVGADKPGNLLTYVYF